MYGYNKKVTFYLYHLFLFTAFSFCWSSVAYSFYYFMQIHEGTSVKEHLEFIYSLGGIKSVLFHPLITVVVTLTSLFILLAFKRKSYLWANLLLLLSTGVILFEYNSYLIRAEYFSKKFFLFSYLNLFIYSAKVSVVLLIQMYVFLISKKALKY